MPLVPNNYGDLNRRDAGADFAAAYLRTFWGYRYVVLAAVLIAAIAGAAVARQRPAAYEAAAMIRLLEAPGTEPSMTTFEAAAVLQDQAVSKALDRVAVEPITGTPLLRVRVVGPDPARAARAANDLIAAAANEVQRQDQQRAIDERARLGRQIEQAAARLADRSASASTPASDARHRLEREAAERVFERLNEELEQRDLRGSVPPWQIVRPAVAPAAPIGASRTQTVIFAAVTGLIAALLVIAVVMYVRVDPDASARRARG